MPSGEGNQVNRKDRALLWLLMATLILGGIFTLLVGFLVDVVM